MKTNKPRSAVLLIEFQKQWTEKGIYNKLIKKQLNNRNVLKNTKNLVKKARKQGAKIIHAPLIINPMNKKGWFAFLTLGKVFTKGMEKSRIAEDLVERGDLIVRGRYAFDAFVGSNLEKILKENKIKNVFVCGFTTDQCVAKTMNTLLKKNFDAYLVSDCTATLNSFLQRISERKFGERVINSQKVIQRI